MGIDHPALRGYDWTKRRREVVERDDHTCQRCGETKADDNGWIEPEVHHIVPGRYLSKEAARIDLNLVTVCTQCHADLEEMEIPEQFAATGREDAAAVLECLSEEPKETETIAEETGLDEERVEAVLEKLETLRIVRL